MVDSIGCRADMSDDLGVSRCIEVGGGDRFEEQVGEGRGTGDAAGELDAFKEDLFKKT